jgi:hypothetical protein
MGAIYTGLVSSNGYVFVTNDAFGVDEDRSAIVRVNKFCGALIVTARGQFLSRVRGVLDKYLSESNGLGKGISMDLAESIVQSFQIEFQKQPVFREKPLPFLLLLVGYNSRRPSVLEHIFVRNRVVKIVEKNEKREYVTDFQIESSVPAKNLFYGHSEVLQYLSQLLPPGGLDLEAMKVFAYLSLTETQKTDNSLFADIRMATVSEDKRFEWVEKKELHRLSDMAKKVDRMFLAKVSSLFSPSGGPVVN